MGTFTLEITLGNDAMQTPQDVAAALRELANRLDALAGSDDEQRIRDANGNTVGRWTLATPVLP